MFEPINESKYQIMKKIILMMAVVAFTVTAQQATAQLRVNVNLNIGAQPEWGPAGYDYVEYYYLPDMDVYYYVPQRQFVYFSSGRWVFGASLPVQYRSYNLYNSYKVVINEPRPYLRNDVYRVRYAKYKGWNGKQPYNKGNSKYKTYKGGGNNNSNGKSNGKSSGKSNGKGHGNH